MDLCNQNKFQKAAGTLSALAAAFSCGGILVITKKMVNSGVESSEVLFYRFLAVFIITGIWLIYKKQSIYVKARQFIALLIIAIAGYGGSTFLLASAFNYMSMGLATMLYFSYPFFVLLIMTLIYHEKMTKNKGIAFLIAIIGLLFLINFQLDILNTGGILAILSGLAYAVYLVGIQKSSVNTLDNRLIVFYVSGISCIFFLIQGKMTQVPSFLSIGVTQIILGICAGVITFFVLTAIAFSIKKIGSTKTSLIISFEAVISLIMGIVFFSEPASIGTWIGAGLMTVSVILVSFKKEKNEEALYDDCLYTTHSPE